MKKGCLGKQDLLWSYVNSRDHGSKHPAGWRLRPTGWEALIWNKAVFNLYWHSPRIVPRISVYLYFFHWIRMYRIHRLNFAFNGQWNRRQNCIQKIFACLPSYTDWGNTSDRQESIISVPFVSKIFEIYSFVNLFDNRRLTNPRLVDRFKTVHSYNRRQERDDSGRKWQIIVIR